MDLAAVTLPQKEAMARFEEYRSAVRARHSAEDERIMRGYKALAKGHWVLSLERTMRLAGLDANRLPRLAICNATAEKCWLRANSAGMEFKTKRWVRDNARARYRIFIPDAAFGIKLEHRGDFSAIVPIIPPRLRPARGLREYHILWEAKWSKEPPKDPALLRHIGGDLWAVLAVWDLTEIERLVIQARADA